VRRIDVVSAREMLAAVRAAFSEADALYMCAAVADWRPARRLSGKWRAKDAGSRRVSLELVRNPDILATVARRKGERLVVGFALETSSGVRRAREKMARKGADYIVLNDSSALNATRASVRILGRDGSRRELADLSKDRIARVLVGLCVER
jgi:phosphopantothenoylcysteine decarboxylase/phosphopantothenate--cysteine ligase